MSTTKERKNKTQKKKNRTIAQRSSRFKPTYDVTFHVHRNMNHYSSSKNKIDKTRTEDVPSSEQRKGTITSRGGRRRLHTPLQREQASAPRRKRCTETVTTFRRNSTVEHLLMKQSVSLKFSDLFRSSETNQ